VSWSCRSHNSELSWSSFRDVVPIIRGCHGPSSAMSVPKLSHGSTRYTLRGRFFAPMHRVSLKGRRNRPAYVSGESGVRAWERILEQQGVDLGHFEPGVEEVRTEHGQFLEL